MAKDGLIASNLAMTKSGSAFNVKMKSNISIIAITYYNQLMMVTTVLYVNQ